MPTKAKILLLDIETAPTKAHVWGLWKQNVGINMIDTDWYMLSWAAKWLGDKKVMSDSLKVYQQAGVASDEFLVQGLWHLLDEADIIIAHNGDRFDVPKINARFLYHGMKPPSTYKTIDTLKVAKKSFRFTSNKLDYLAQHLKVGKKMSTGGFELWQGCMDGDEASWDKMVKYNKRDVKILEKVYFALRPWIKPHPNLALYDDKEERRCPVCGGNHVHKRGNYYTNVGRYQRYYCNDCGSWSRERTNNQEKGKRNTVLNNVA